MSKDSKTTTVQKVPKYIEQASKELWAKAKDFGAQPFEPYTGDRVADLAPDQMTVFQKLRDMISSAPQVLPEALEGARKFANAPAQQISTERVVDEGGRLGAVGDYFNQYVDEALQPALRAIQDAADQERKRIGAGATHSGAFGDARHGVLESELGGKTMTAMGDVANRAYKDALDTAMGLRTSDLNRFTQADLANAGFNEQALNRGFTGMGGLLNFTGADQANLLQRLNALMGGGAMQAAHEQAELDSAFQEFMREYGHDFDIMGLLSSTLSGVPYSRTTTQTQPDNSMWQVAGSVASSILPALI